MAESDDLRDTGGVDEGDYEDLPRIIIKDDNIIVLDEDWVEKDVKKRFDDRVLGDEDIEKLLDEGVLFLPLSDGEKQNLEESLGGSSDKTEGVNFYEPKKSSNSYESDNEEGYDPFVGVELKSFEEVESERRGGRSILEIAGFKDFEAEEKRKRNREDFI